VPHRAPGVAIAALRGVLGRWPYTLTRYQDRAFASVVESEVERVRPEYALVNHLHLAPYVAQLGRVPMILREHNAEHRWMEQQARRRAGSASGVYASWQARRLRFAERDLCERAALVLAIQDRETDALRSLAPKARVRTLPIGIDLARFTEPSPSSPPIVLLPGSFSWEPNVEGAIRFLEAGWPEVRAEFPDVRLRIAGKQPPPSLRRAAERAHVELAADVPSMEEELSRATIVVVPLWIGAGARVKIVEAMAARVPVVATSVAAEGLDVEPELHYLAGETPRDLGDSIRKLLKSSAERLRLSAQGRALAEARWCLQSVARRQEELIREALEERSREAGRANP